ncbi:MAG: cytochrome P450 [Bacteriovoracaceae bacterium]
MKKLPKGPSLFSALGDVPAIRRDIIGVFQGYFDQYGDDICFSFIGKKTIMSRSSEFHNYILKTKSENYKKSFAYDLMKPIFGEGLLVAHGDHWRENRQRMNSAFGPEQLKLYAPKIEKLTLDLLLQWSVGSSPNIHQDLIMLTLGIIGDCLFGRDIRTYGPHVSQAMLTIMNRVEGQILNPLSVPLWIPVQKNKKYLQSIETINQISEQLIDVVLAHKKVSDNEKTLLARLLPVGEVTPEIKKNLRDQIMTLLITGHDTSANLLTFALQILANDKNLYQELLQEIEKNPDADPALLTSFLNEVMRLYPPVWMASRTAINEDHDGQFPIEKGMLVALVPYYLHRHPEYWKEAEQFNAKRFMSEYPAHAFMPFGAGPRACVAMSLGMLEMKIILKKILLELEFESLSPIKVKPTLTLKPDGPVPMKFKRRKRGA